MIASSYPKVPVRDAVDRLLTANKLTAAERPESDGTDDHLAWKWSGMKDTIMNQLPSVVLRYIQGLKSRDVAMIADSLADEVEIILATRTLTKKSFLSYLTALYAAFPDWRYQNDEAKLCHDGSISIRWSQGGTHTETWVLPGSPPVPPTRKRIQIPEQFFYYKLAGDKIVEIRPEHIPGGVPEAILDQIGVTDTML